MARDGLSFAVRSVFTTTGPKSGTTSGTFYFRWGGGAGASTTDFAALVSDVGAFWNGPAGGAGYISYYLGPQILRGTGKLIHDVYSMDLADPTHVFGSPVYTATSNLGTPGTSNPMPNEMACVLSYRAAYGSDPEHSGTTRPRASDRGRLYLGPLCDAALTSVGAPNGTFVADIVPAFITYAKNAFIGLKSSALVNNFTISVYSRKEHLLKPVADIAMDNSFDVQRRREVEPPSLQNWIAV